MPTTTPRTHCQNCGQKLPDKPLSLCAYCAMPVGLDEAPSESGESPNADRIGRIESHDDFEAAIAATPSEGVGYWKGKRRKFIGQGLIITGALILLVPVFLRAESGIGAILGHPVAILSLLLVAAGVALIVKGTMECRVATSQPLLRRAGMIIDRRSDTTLRGWSGSTMYYFMIEFPGGVSGEFAYPGRGSHEEPYVTNLPGVAYTRGPELLFFRHIRV